MKFAIAISEDGRFVVKSTFNYLQGKHVVISKSGKDSDEVSC